MSEPGIASTRLRALSCACSASDPIKLRLGRRQLRSYTAFLYCNAFCLEFIPAQTKQVFRVDHLIRMLGCKCLLQLRNSDSVSHHRNRRQMQARNG